MKLTERQKMKVYREIAARKSREQGRLYYAKNKKHVLKKHKEWKDKNKDKFYNSQLRHYLKVCIKNKYITKTEVVELLRVLT